MAAPAYAYLSAMLTGSEVNGNFIGSDLSSGKSKNVLYENLFENGGNMLLLQSAVIEIVSSVSNDSCLRQELRAKSDFCLNINI